MSDLVPRPTGSARTDVELSDLHERAQGYVAASRAKNTLRAYSSDWRAFTAWCQQRGLAPLPADASTVALYLTDLAGTVKASTIGRRLSSISIAHQAAGVENPSATVLVRSTWTGIRRSIGVAQTPKAALLTEDIRRMVECVPDSLIGTRDRAVVLLGFASALRRSELVGLDVEDVTEATDGLVLRVRRSKTDQQGEGREIGIPVGAREMTCPVRAIRIWLEQSRIESGALFRSVSRHEHLGTTGLSDRAVALIVKRAAQVAGLDPSLVAGHSLRSGMATSAANGGASEADIMRQTGHRSVTVVRRYIRRGTLFEGNAAGRLGL
jgi:site-specific recombinase XerD